jgi:signal transduction histidine kinase
MDPSSVEPLIRAAPVPLALVEAATGTILLASPGFSTLVQQPGGSLVGSRVSDHLDSGDDALLGDGGDGKSGGVRRVRRASDGRTLELRSWRPVPTRDAAPDTVALHLSEPRPAPESPPPGPADVETALSDEARRSAKESGPTLAQEESRARAIFLASVSHELRTPLNSIMGHAQLLQEGIPVELPEPLQKHVERIMGASRHLLSMVEPIVRTARSQLGADPPEAPTTERVEVTEVARAVLDIIRPMAAAKGLEIDLEIQGTSTTMVARRRDLRQILINLLSNAVKFTESGRIGLVVECGETCRFTVRDTGIGMSAATRDRIFDRFWRAGEPGEGGSGIGLWVTRTLVENLGGSIEVESEEGGGSTFRVHLPVRERD